MWKRRVSLGGTAVALLTAVVAAWVVPQAYVTLAFWAGVSLGVVMTILLYPYVLAKATFRRIAKRALLGTLGMPPAGACFIFYPGEDGTTFTAAVNVNPLIIPPEKLVHMLRAHANMYDWDDREGVSP